MINQPDKLVLQFKATGSAPVLKQQKFKISSSQRFQAVIDFLRRQLQMTASDLPLFLYVNSAFAPTPDEHVWNLFKMFNVNGVLTINYSNGAAWG